MRRLLPLLLLAGCALGCKTGVYPDPNEPAKGYAATPDILQRNLSSISDSLLAKRVKGYITTQQYKNLLAKAADELVTDMDLEHVAPADAWRYAEVLRAGRNWKAAERMLEVAVKAARAEKNEDRRINDTLRLAEVKAYMGEYDASIETANSVMDAAPADSAPILPAILYEIAPVLKGHDRDDKTAMLLESAADKHLKTVVDGSSDAGKDFIAARPFHVRKAYGLAADLYGDAGDKAGRERILERDQQATEDFEKFMRSRQGAPISHA